LQNEIYDDLVMHLRLDRSVCLVNYRWSFSEINIDSPAEIRVRDTYTAYPTERLEIKTSKDPLEVKHFEHGRKNHPLFVAFSHWKKCIYFTFKAKPLSRHDQSRIKCPRYLNRSTDLNARTFSLHSCGDKPEEFRQRPLISRKEMYACTSKGGRTGHGERRELASRNTGFLPNQPTCQYFIHIIIPARWDLLRVISVFPRCRAL